MLPVTTVACDESGSEGENLVSAQHPVFVHASTNVSSEVASGLMNCLRAAVGSQALELKSRTALLPQNRPALLDFLEGVGDAGNIHLVDKSYFVTAKLVSTLIARNPDAWLPGQPRQWADYLDSAGPHAVGESRWSLLLTRFNQLVRAHRRQHATRPTPEGFFDALEDAWRHSRDEYVTELLHQMWMDREDAADLARAPASALREFDPMWPALVAVARTWTLRLGNVPLEYVADDYGDIDSESRSQILEAARQPMLIMGRVHSGVDLRGLRFVDSKSDARVQVADIVGGVGREMARLAMSGVFDDELQIRAHELLDFNVMSSTGSPLDVLVERRPVRYMAEWTALG